MNPLPAPCRGPSGSRSVGSSPRVGYRVGVLTDDRDAASMFTTAGLMRSATSAKFTTPDREAGLGRSDGPNDSRAVAVETTGVLGTPPPARMTPTRNATVEESASVMNVKRLDIVHTPGIATRSARQTPLLSPGTPLPSAS